LRVPVLRTDLYPDKEWEVIDDINAQLILPNTYGAQGIDKKMQNQERANGYQSSKRMGLQDKIMNLIPSQPVHDNILAKLPYKHKIFYFSANYGKSYREHWGKIVTAIKTYKARRKDFF
jgi:hypothetical protein